MSEEQKARIVELARECERHMTTAAKCKHSLFGTPLAWWVIAASAEAFRLAAA